MQAKKPLDVLYPDLEVKIVQDFLTDADLVNLAMTSKGYSKLFKPQVDARRLSKFLSHVVLSEYDAVQGMLRNNFHLMAAKGKVTDCSAREFKNVSGFEYALWALDKHMWTTMLACLPLDETSLAVLIKLCDQYNQINTVGVTYQLNAKSVTEQHFNIRATLIQALEVLVKDITLHNKWIEGVGGAQKLLPMHVVYEYCSNDLFFPVQKFISKPLQTRLFHHFITGIPEYWFAPDSRLGIEFACLKFAGACLAYPESLGMAETNRKAIKKLWSIRMNDFIELETQLGRRHQQFFKLQINPPSVSKFLRHVVRGAYDAVVEMLSNNIHLMAEKNTITDCSDRKFENISGFEYALWALDKRMWTMMLGCIPPGAEGQSVLERLWGQYHQIQTEGVTYHLQANNVTEPHFNFQDTIIKALHILNEARKKPMRDEPALIQQWVEGVCGAQKLLPVHVVYEYGSDLFFGHESQFIVQPPPKRWRREDWFDPDSKLGIAESLGLAAFDLSAMKSLFKVRTKNFIELEAQLKNQMVAAGQSERGCVLS
ncbi:MAG: hypothetical protein ACHP65_05370 [Legionellales bacterium]